VNLDMSLGNTHVARNGDLLMNNLLPANRKYRCRNPEQLTFRASEAARLMRNPARCRRSSRLAVTVAAMSC
jgi:hypothetical protein